MDRDTGSLATGRHAGEVRNISLKIGYPHSGEYVTGSDSRLKMKLFLCLCLLASAATIICQEERSSRVQPATANLQTLPIQWSPVLQLKSLANIPERLNQPFLQPFTGIVREKSATILNCNDYLRLSKLGFKTTSDREYRILRFNTIDCVAINLLKIAKPAHSTFVSDFRLTPEAFSLLPPELAPTVSQSEQANARAADLAGESWKTYAKDAQASAGDIGSQIVVIEPNWNTKVTEYGRADFNGDGLEDLLVRTDTSATKGTATNEQLFILGRKASSGRLILEQTIAVP